MRSHENIGIAPCDTNHSDIGRKSQDKQRLEVSDPRMRRLAHPDETRIEEYYLGHF